MSEQIISNNNDLVTVFTQVNSAGKTFQRDNAGNITKESAIVSFATGQVHHVPTPEAFAALLQEITGNACQALMLGFIPGTEDGKPFELTSKRDYLDRLSIPQNTRDTIPPTMHDFINDRLVAARLKKHVIGSSWAMLDRDITSGMPDELAGLSQADWLARMELLLPGLSGAGKVITPSSSGRLIVDGLQQPTRNFHVYYQMQDPDDLERVGHAMLINSFDVGLGYHKPIGTSGTTVPWSIHDPTTFSRERLCYEAQPVVFGAGLSVAPADIKVYPGGVLNTSAVITPEGTRHGLRMRCNGSGSSIDAGVLDLDQLIETKDYGMMTIREYRDGFYGKLRCQCFNRESVSINAYLQKLPNGQVFYFDNGSRIGFKTKIDVDEVLAGFNIEMIDPAAGELITLGKFAVDDVKQVDLIAHVFLSIPEIQALHLINHQDTLYYFTGSAYKESKSSWLIKKITKLIPKCYHMDVKTGMPVKGNPGRHVVNSVAGCVMAEVDHNTDDESVPFYRHGKSHDSQVDANKLIVFRNGSLDIDTGKFLQSSPELFAINPLPHDYDQNADQPARFIKFLNELWPDDENSHRCLQEMFGYLISGETNLQKMFMLIGVRRGGKGVIGRIIKMIIGHDAMAGTTMKAVAGDFGLQGLIDKKVWMIADARVGKSLDQAVIVERFLTITGEDVIGVPRKHKDEWTGTLAVRPVVISNMMPRLNESSKALLSRLVMLKFNVTFQGREDINLSEKLESEISGIVKWSLVGLRRLRKAQRFTESTATAEMKLDFEKLNNPLSEFIQDVVTVDSDAFVSSADLFNAWRNYSSNKGIHTLKSINPFIMELKLNLPMISEERQTVGLGDRKTRTRGLTGIRLCKKLADMPIIGNVRNM